MRNRTLGFCVPMLYHWATEILVRKSPKKVYIWHAYCILLGSAMPMASCSVNRISKMVCFFKLGKEIDSGEQGPSQSSFMTRVLHTAGISNIRASERGNPKVWGSIPHGDSEFFLCPTLVTKRKTSFSISLSSLKITIFLVLFTINIYCKQDLDLFERISWIYFHLSTSTSINIWEVLAKNFDDPNQISRTLWKKWC